MGITKQKCHIMAEKSNCHDDTRGPQLPDQAVAKKRHVCMTNHTYMPFLGKGMYV